MIKSSFKGIVLCTLLGNIILTVSAAVDPLQSAIDDILRPPTVSKSTLPDGSVVTTVAIS